MHRALGPGLLESVYEVCLLHELNKRGPKAARQVLLPVGTIASTWMPDLTWTLSWKSGWLWN